MAKFIRALGLLALAWIIAHPTTGQAQDEPAAPQAKAISVVEMLGLEWGLSVDQVLDLGYYTLEQMELEAKGQPFNASVYPEILHDIGQLILYFSTEDQLWRIAILGKGVTDGSGTAKELIARYEVIRGQLADIYGPGETFHHNTTDNPQQDFVLGAMQNGQAWHFSEFVTTDEHIQLGIVANTVVAGHYALYLKNTVLEEAVLARLEADRQLGANADDAPPKDGESD
jgi:hypothetical protein